MEDRIDCPCVLSVPMMDLPAYPAMLYVDGRLAGIAQRDTVLSLWTESGGLAAVTAVSGAVPAPDLAVRIPLGQAAPPLYTFRGVADCSGESARIPVKMHKQYCSLTVQMKRIPEAETPKGAFASGVFAWKIRGTVNGMDLKEGRPVEGEFHCGLEGDVCRLPRQRPGDPLWLELELEDRVLRRFPLGNYLESVGYDWTVPDLEDRVLEIDVSLTRILFRCDFWSTVEVLEVVI